MIRIGANPIGWSNDDMRALGGETPLETCRSWSFLRAVVEGVYTVPGDGMADYEAVFRALPGYSGWVVIEAEQDPARANPLHYARMGFTNLKRFLAEAGRS